jgi:glutamate 5-kinase
MLLNHLPLLLIFARLFVQLAHREQYQNAKNTFSSLLDYGVIPIVNENDTVANEELRFGDNDRLGAMVAGLVRSDWLFLLTDVDALYTSNPKKDPDAKRIAEIQDLNQLDTMLLGDLSAGSRFGTGGMQTKIIASRLGAAQGTTTVIMHARDPSLMKGVMEKTADTGTVILPLDTPVSKTKQWILGLPPMGQLVIDNGASKALRNKSSLFPAGVTEVIGAFPEQSVVSIVDLERNEIGRGLVNYSSADMAKIASKSSDDFEELLDYVSSDFAIHRSNIILLSIEEAPPPTIL